MSLSLAFSSALSGVSLAARGTQIVADNIANAQTDAYGVRGLTQAARVHGGVAIKGVSRHMDPALLADLRQARAQAKGDGLLAAFWQKVETTVGVPGEDGSLGTSITWLNMALHAASLQPDQTALLQQGIQAAGDIAGKIRQLNDLLDAERDHADVGIAQNIAWLNGALKDIAELNQKIQRQTLLGGAPEGLKDLRQALVDEVAQRLPVQEFARDDGRIMLMARDGTILVDRDATQFSFARNPYPAAGDSADNGALSYVMLNDREIGSDAAIFSDGSIGAFLRLRDDAAPTAQRELDLLTADLIARFSGPEIDPSLDPGDFGLFSLAGQTTLPATTVGIAGRIALNPVLDPAQTGEAWRLRAGVNAAVPGDVLDNSLLDRLARALDLPTALEAASSPMWSAQGHATELLSGIATHRLGADQRSSFNTARAAMFSEALAAQGVDTDAELSKLLMLEQAYSANARVLATVDAMLRSILEI